ncbi:MAG TPA: periplasmic heavy metal sensor [Gemmatimonadales bacterium]|nr:periplasmic heavy metal sensor [Gemmatimonadales bacterium]
MPLTRSTRSAVMLLLAAFVLGAAAGVAGVALFGPDTSYRPRRPDPERYQKKLVRELGLTKDQQDSVHAILQLHRPAVDSAWHEAETRGETLRAAIRSEIARQLTPDQQRKYQLMNQRTDSLRRKATQ